jgi:hypothetical protein
MPFFKLDSNGNKTVRYPKKLVEENILIRYGVTFYADKLIARLERVLSPPGDRKIFVYLSEEHFQKMIKTTIEDLKSVDTNVITLFEMMGWHAFSSGMEVLVRGETSTHVIDQRAVGIALKRYSVYVSYKFHFIFTYYFKIFRFYIDVL